MNGHRLWRRDRVSDEAWRAPQGRTRGEQIAEQDHAAGGAEAREIPLAGGRRGRASIALRRQPKSRRVYAYLRWSLRGKTHERYVGEVTHDNRRDNLAGAWRIVHEAHLLDHAVEHNIQR